MGYLQMESVKLTVSVVKRNDAGKSFVNMCIPMLLLVNKHIIHTNCGLGSATCNKWSPPTIEGKKP